MSYKLWSILDPSFETRFMHAANKNEKYKYFAKIIIIKYIFILHYAFLHKK